MTPGGVYLQRSRPWPKPLRLGENGRVLGVHLQQLDVDWSSRSSVQHAEQWLLSAKSAGHQSYNITAFSAKSYNLQLTAM